MSTLREMFDKVNKRLVDVEERVTLLEDRLAPLGALLRVVVEALVSAGILSTSTSQERPRQLELPNVNDSAGKSKGTPAQRAAVEKAP